MTSIWLDKIDYKESPKLNKNINVDVLIIGGGITGMSIAYALKDTNLKIALVERNFIGQGVTARTTGKLTYLQELIYTDLTETYCQEKAKLYLESQIDAIKIIDKIVKENKIDCDLENDNSYLFTNDAKDIKKIDKGYELLKSFGINVLKTDKLPDNKKVKTAIYVDNTKTFHPLKYLLKLKELLKDKINIYENTKIIRIDKGICYTENNVIKAKKIVIAMHYPYFLLPLLMPLKTHLEKSYICAYKVNRNLHFSAINATKPSLSIRYINNYKIVLSNAHNLAFNNNDKDNFNNLISRIKEKPEYMWTNKDIITSDKLPYIGEIKDNLYVATGYNTWGMSNGILAGTIIADIIQNKNNKYIQLFDPKRGFNVNKVIDYPINIVSSAKSFIGTKLNKNKSWYSDRVRFEKKNGRNIAVYTDENNKEHVVYNICPHLKCSLIFNEIEKTWDCPCHGSRFDIDGKCIEGPSNYDITYKN